MEAMRSEAEILACTDPMSLPEESRFLLEMGGDRYVKGDSNFHDKSYWLSAMRAAVCAGKVSRTRGTLMTGVGHETMRRGSATSPVQESGSERKELQCLRGKFTEKGTFQ